MPIFPISTPTDEHYDEWHRKHMSDANATQGEHKKPSVKDCPGHSDPDNTGMCVHCGGYTDPDVDDWRDDPERCIGDQPKPASVPAAGLRSLKDERPTHKG